MESNIAIFDTFKIRRQYDDAKEVWYFSVIDIVRVLTDQLDFQKARKYWNKLSERLKKEGSESVTNCHQLKLKAVDGKKARLELEGKTGKSVISNQNFLPKDAKKKLIERGK